MIDIPIHAQVECIDGHGGQTTRVIINPAVRQVTHFVVREWTPPLAEHLVSIDEVVETAPDRIQLRCTTDELAAMEPFIVTQYIQITRPHYEDYLYVAWPYAVRETTEWVPMEYERIPADELAVRRGAQVQATDGHVGHVGELLVDEASGEITHLVLRDGHPWDQKEVTIPISGIDRVQGDTVYLKLDKQAIGSLPAIPVRRREGLEEMVATLRARQEDSRRNMRAQIEAQLQDWRAEIERLKIKAAQADAASRREPEERIVALHAKWEAARAELREKMETQLQVWQVQLQELAARQADARAEAKADLLRQINLLKEKQQAMRATLEQNIEDDIAELDAMSAATIEMITTGMYKMAAEERAEHERRAEELRTRRERAQAKLRDLRKSSATARKDLSEGMDEAKADLKDALGRAASRFE